MLPSAYGQAHAEDFGYALCVAEGGGSMPGYHIRRKTDDEIFAEYATQAIVIVATLGLVVVGSIVVGVFQEIGRVYAEHGQKGQPKAAQLRRASKSLLGAWGAACLLAVINYPALGALLGGTSTLAFMMYVLVMGKLLGPGGQPIEGADELDTYLEPFAELTDKTPAAAPRPVGATHLRVIHTKPRGNGSSSPGRSGR